MRGVRSLPGWCVGLLASVLFGALAFRDYFPPLESRQRLRVFFDTPRPGAHEPLIVSGQPGRGDFLYVKYLDGRTVQLGFDRWGQGGPVSKPVPITGAAGSVLELDFPPLQQVVGNPFLPEERVRVVLDGETLLDLPLPVSLRKPMRVWWGRNPIGGSSCGPEFHGRIVDARGRLRAGGVRELFSRGERFRGWCRYGWAQVASVIGAGFVTGWLWSRWRRRRLAALAAVRPAAIEGRRGWRDYRVAILTGLVGATGFAWVLNGATWAWDYADEFGDFYDFQALSLLRGRLDVPQVAIGDEAFIHAGRYYGYFGLTPALLRLPFVAFGLGFGVLTRAYLMVAFVACLGAAYLIFRDAWRQVRRDASPPSRWLEMAFLLNVSGGSTLFFLASRAYVYHEAILWGVALALWSAWCALRQLAAPESRWGWGALVLGVLAVQARPPGGLFALTLLGGVAVVLAWRQRRSRASVRRWIAVAGLAVAGVFSFHGIGYLKFGVFDGCPLRLHVQYDARRLAVFEGKQFHLSNLPFNGFTYALSPNLRLEPRFPWFFLKSSKPGPGFPGAKVDYAEPTLALPYAMSGLVLLAAGSLGWAWRRKETREVIGLWWAAALPMTLALFSAVAVAHRYTADFCPFLIGAAAFGTAGLGPASRRLRVAAGGVLAIATTWSVILTAAITLHYQGAVVWGVPDDVRARYKVWQRRVGDELMPERR